MNCSTQLPAALIFDMDGVLVDSNPFHLQKWIELLNERGITFDPRKLPRQILGQRNDVAFRLFFGSQFSGNEVARLEEDLEEKFRKSFGPYVKPLPGLSALIAECHLARVPMAVASSATAKNVEFIVDALGFRPYFERLTTGGAVTRPKPDPEIYLKAAQEMELDPRSCVAFEDSFVGVEAAKSAGMKCVAIASTFALADLREQTRADRVVASFAELGLERLRQLFERR